jgi:hypothetical protein
MVRVLMCWFNDARVRVMSKVNIRLSMSELIQFEIRISTKRYFSSNWNCRFERLSVKGVILEPCPPPKMMANIGANS